jgi:gamma-carbonic anhydrase
MLSWLDSRRANFLSERRGRNTILTRQPDIRPYRGKHPQIAASAYIDPAAVVIGDVVIGEDSSVWPCSVVRGDVHYIRIGERTNIQDGSICHVMRDAYPLILGDDVTIGHSVTLHGCTIESRCLIGMGAVVLNGVVVGSGSIVAAGTLITERTAIPPGSLVMGSPGKVKRALSEIDKATIDAYAKRYVSYKNIYREEPRA